MTTFTTQTTTTSPPKHHVQHPFFAKTTAKTLNHHQLFFNAQFAQKSHFFNKNNRPNTLDFPPIRSTVAFNGRAIFQKERADKDHRRGPATELAKHSGNRLRIDETRTLSQRMCFKAKYGKHGLYPQLPNRPRVTISCDLATEPGLRKIGK